MVRVVGLNSDASPSATLGPAIICPEHKPAPPRAYDERMDLKTLHELYRYQQWADLRTLAAVRAHPGAADDADLRKRLHHIAGVQRGFLALFLARPFDVATEMRVPDSLEELERRFAEAHAEEMAFVAGLDEAAQLRTLDIRWFPGLWLSLGQALLQVVMHSQHHRGQCSMRLRELGGNPPMLDYIVWLNEQQGKAADAGAG